jgi:hypothetical protein
MPLKIIKYIGVIILTVSIFTVSFYAGTLANCILNPESDQTSGDQIDPTE